MMTKMNSRRLIGGAILAALSLALSGCFIMPGKFAAELTLNKGNEFAFTYDGEIHFLGLSKLAQMGAGQEAFMPYCDDVETGEQRDCDEDELAEQRAEWDASATSRALEAEQRAKQMAAALGGIDPTDPEAGFKLEQLLLRHEGWNEVTHMGDGKFEVGYSIAGELTHDMMFPVIEGFDRRTVFVEAIVRKGDVVRVNAPGFAPPTEDSMASGMLSGLTGMSGLMSLAMLSEAGEDNGAEVPPGLPIIDGSFTITTNGDILANNTDEGPSASGDRKALVWTIDQSTKVAPTALIKLTP